MSIGNRISELRKSHNYSQEYVAEQLDVSRQAVSKWEQELSSPDTNNLIALAQLFGVSVEYLATGKEYSTTPTGNNPSPQTGSRKTIIGYMLLACGLLTLILGILFSRVLVLLSVYCLVGAMICLIFKKISLLAILWVYFILILASLSMSTGFNPLIIFSPDGLLHMFRGSMNINMMVSLGMIIAFVVLLAVTVVQVARKKNQRYL